MNDLTLSTRNRPGSLFKPICDAPGATALEQASAAGKFTRVHDFTPVHDAWWEAVRKAHGDAEGTRALIQVFLLHRHMPHEHIAARPVHA